MAEPLSRRWALLLSVVAAVAVLLVLEGLFSWAYAFKTAWVRSRPFRAEAGHADHDPELGWVHRPNLRAENLYGPGRNLTTNAQGFRAGEDYTPAVPENRTRVVFLGDSFTMGFGVDDSQTFPAFVEAMDPTIQSVNMGMGAYGIGQSYLWYRRDGAGLEADVLVFSFIAHDFQRLILDHHMSPKPRLALVDGELVTLNTPVPFSSWEVTWREAAREFTYWLDIAKLLRLGLSAVTPSRTDGGSQQRKAGPWHPPFGPVAQRVFEELARHCRAHDQQLLLVYLPTTQDTKRPNPVARWVRSTAEERGLRFVDLTPEFTRLPPLQWGEAFLPDGHYSPAGNRLVATLLLAKIQALAASEARAAS